MTTSQATNWLIKAAENTVIESRCRQVVIGKLDTEGESLPLLICKETATVPIEGVLPSRVLMRQIESKLTDYGSERPHTK